MKTYAAHLADCRDLLAARPPMSIPVAASLGFVLAADIVARADLPAFASSAMDGYAVRVADVPGLLRVVGEVAAGQTPAVAVDPGTAVRIMTGAALPDDTEAILPLEEVEERGGVLHALVSTVPGRHIRPAGDDVRPGDVVLDQGQVVGAAQLAALISAGVTSVRVRPVWRVAVLSTGDELVAAGRIPGPAQIVDCNGPALAAAAIAAGAEVVHLGKLPDVPDVLIGALDALPACDLIVTSGGVSMGAYDVVKAALKPLGIGFEQVAMQPGKPQGWGHFRGGPAFLGLPGNPAAALICFELFGRAALGRERSASRAALGACLLRTSDRKRQFLRGRLAGTTVHVAGGPGSHLIVGLARADCLVVVPEGVSRIEAGEMVEVIPLQSA
jgi:molybdopterin molybdotransferase